MKTSTMRLVTGLVVAVAVCIYAYAISATSQRTAQGEPKAVFVKSSSPEVAKAIADALAKSEFKSSDYRVSLPKTGKEAAISRGALVRKDILQLEKEVKVSNKNFGKGAGDIIILVKVITKGSAAEQLVKNALRGIDSKLYQLEVVR
ncbi:MAG: hypothetical protein ACRD5H_08075 [Nitrososphaerales archaeon]